MELSSQLKNSFSMMNPGIVHDKDTEIAREWCTQQHLGAKWMSICVHSLTGKQTHWTLEIEETNLMSLTLQQQCWLPCCRWWDGLQWKWIISAQIHHFLQCMCLFWIDLEPLKMFFYPSKSCPRNWPALVSTELYGKCGQHASFHCTPKWFSSPSWLRGQHVQVPDGLSSSVQR